ncbi:MAG: DUF4342 domain-containing protein [Anaerolineae bacterium]|nr:DUF4342 domain-containing protein [Anaerolineae bacterium]
MTEQMNEITTSETPTTAPHTFAEELSVAGNQLLERLQSLLQEGNIRRLIIKDGNTDRTLLEVPLTLGVVAGAGLLVFIPPFLAAVGAIAALVANVRIVIERYSNPEDADKEKTDSVIDITPGVE